MKKGKISKKNIILVIIIVMIILSMGACTSGKEQNSSDSERTADDELSRFNGEKLGVVTGAITYMTAEKIGSIPINYSESSAGVEDVRLGRVAGFIQPLSAVRLMAVELGDDKFEAVPVPKDIFAADVGAISHDQANIDRFNKFLNTIKEDGTLTEMQERWFSKDLDLNTPMPEIESSGKNGTFKVAICSDAIPYVFVGNNGDYLGYSVELMLRFGEQEGLEIEFTNMDFGAIIPYIISKKADFAIANIAITEERKKSVLFTDPYFEEQHAVLALKENPVQVETKTGFIAWLKRGIENNLLVDNRWKMIVDGLGVTMIISFGAQVCGTILGCFICFLLLRRNRFARGFGNLYCGFIHGTPAVVLLMITYYIIFRNSDISNVLVAIAAFTMVMAANVAQTLEGAIKTVDPVEIEAARSIGFSSLRAFTTVTLPQAIRRALPGYTNGFVELVKATAIVGYIAIQDLTRAGDIIRSRTYDAYFPLILLALIYLIVTAIIVWVFKRIVRKINKGVSL